MYKKRGLLKNNKGISPIIETLVAIGISITLLVVFYVSATNIFTAHENPAVDLKAKCIGIAEALLSSPGTGTGDDDYEWQNTPANVDFPGLATTETLAYGLININQGTATVKEYHDFSGSNIGVLKTCFLAGTKIVLSDESYKNIEDITVGDMVKSYDEKTGNIVDRKITQVFHHNPEEMGDYYLIINNQLRVTPEHKFYSNGRWINAGDLNIGDPLFYTSSQYTVTSIEKIYEKEPTYNFEVEGCHNYFVGLDTSKALVHNPPDYRPTARFTWFDSDGPHGSGTKIFLNAEGSTTGYGTISEYKWYFNPEIDNKGIPTSSHNISSALPYAEWDLENNDIHIVVLNVTNDYGSGHSGYCTEIVQANQPTPYVVEQKPWALTGKDIYPPTGTNTLSPYGGDYYVKYTYAGTADGGNNKYIFEIKDKNKPPCTIIDLGKFENLENIIYYDLQVALGLVSDKILYNFKISLFVSGKEYEYGAYDEDVHALESFRKDVLVYHKPKYDGGLIKPYYEKGYIVVRFFIGGRVPNYPPGTPSSPEPGNEATNVPWNVELHWRAVSDPNGDPVTYDVYFGKDEADLKLQTRPNPKDTVYDPNDPEFDEMYPSLQGLLFENTKYYWRIVAWDNQEENNNRTGPVWSFTTAANSPPNTPNTPTPANNEIDVNAVTSILQWRGSDPNEWMGDKLSYDVYFDEHKLGSGQVLPKISNKWGAEYWNPKNNSETGVILPRLKYYTKYLWQIEAFDLYMSRKLGPEWSFTTAEKGLDQYVNYGFGEGESTIKKIGQTFISGADGTLRAINLSIKLTVTLSDPPEIPPDENISVKIYKVINDEPLTLVQELASAKIPSFNDYTSYVWKKVNFPEGLELEKDVMYLIILETREREYLWEFGEAIGAGGSVEDGPYLHGDAWLFEGSEKLKGQDFTFKTYVYRSFELDVFNDEGIQDYGLSIMHGMAQAFKADRSGDLMKVNLTLNNSNINNKENLTVRIYKAEIPPEDLSEGILAITTIEGFTNQEYGLKSAEFLFKPVYIEAGNTYCIVVTSESENPNPDYNWQATPAYSNGRAFSYQPVGPEGPLWQYIEDTGFFFVVYRDDIG